MANMATTRIRKGARPHLYLDEWFADRGVNDEQVAGRVGVARQTIWKWRTQQHRLDPIKIALLASALDCHPTQLWGPPNRPSLDALVVDAPDDLRLMAHDVVSRLVKKAG